MNSSTSLRLVMHGDLNDMGLLSVKTLMEWLRGLLFRGRCDRWFQRSLILEELDGGEKEIRTSHVPLNF